MIITKMNKTKKGENGSKSQKGYWNAIMGIFLITALFGSGLYLAYDDGGITGMAVDTATATGSATEPHLYEPIYINKKPDRSYDVVYQYDYSTKTWGVSGSIGDKGDFGNKADVQNSDSFEDGMAKIYGYHTSNFFASKGNVKDDIEIGDGENPETYETNFFNNKDNLNLNIFKDQVTTEAPEAEKAEPEEKKAEEKLVTDSPKEDTEPEEKKAEEKPVTDSPKEDTEPEEKKAEEKPVTDAPNEDTNSEEKDKAETQVAAESDEENPTTIVNKYSLAGKQLTQEQYDRVILDHPVLKNQIVKLSTASTSTSSPQDSQQGTNQELYSGHYNGIYITNTKDYLNEYGAKDITKVTDKKSVNGNVLITTTGENGPSVLNYGGETVTLPAKSEVDFKNMDKATFTVLHTLDEQKWGGLSNLEVEDGYYNLGNLKGFTNSGGEAVVLDMSDREGFGTGDSTVWWSSMTVVHKDGTTTTYDCNQAQDRCNSNDGVPTLGDYTSSKRAADGITVTQIVDKVGTVSTTTNFAKITLPDGSDVNAIVDAEGNYYYSEVGLFGRTWKKIDKGDCREGKCETSGEKPDKLPKGAEDADNEANYGRGPDVFETMNLFGDILRKWQQDTAGYSGMSLLYDEPDPVIELDETMSALLGGIDGWTSLICKSKMTDSLDSGMAFSSNPNGAYAHVEGEKIIMGHYNESSLTKTQYYKISASVDPGGEDTGCDIKFSLYLKGSGGTLYLYEDNGSVSYSSSEKTYELARGDSGISYAGSAMEFFEDERNFDKVCIKFHDLYPEFVSAGEGCLVGVNEGDEICNKLNDLGTTESFDDPCHNSFGFIMPHCWG
ncbi:MAG: hypothetical protein U9R34_06530 [Nanoarchaeota archaeon]|nr:hypothetical protein [Nanoarchaeota archaeon]